MTVAPAVPVTTDDAARARAIRWVGFDVDGVLTDGGIYVGDLDGTAVELKRFNIQDGLAIKFLQAAGLEVALVSGRRSTATARRAAELGIADVVQDDAAQKVKAIAALLARKGIDWREAAFVGDDLPDVAVLRRVGLAVAVGNATGEAARAAHWTLARMGGHGAVREFVERLLVARGEWDTLVARYVADRAEDAA